MKLSAMLQNILAGLLVAAALSGCFYHDQVRHLASDVCLVTQDLTKKEVVAYLGPPDKRSVDPEKGEVWSYFEVKKSTLRKTPYVGDKLGTENYDLVTITFSGDRVTTCLYRSLSETEFKETGLKANDQFQE